MALTYPLVRALGTHVPGTGAGDNLAFVWNVWWARYALASGADYFRTTHLFAPIGTSLVLNTSTPLLAWTGATLLGGVALVRAHNTLLLCGLAANGFVTYLLAHALTRQPWPSVLAGTVFASSAYVSVHLLGHFNLVHAWVIPLAALAWVSLVARPSAARAVATGAAFAATAYADYYYLVYAVMFAATWWAVTATDPRLSWHPGRWVTARRSVATAGGFALAVAVAIGATGGIAFELGRLHVSAMHPRNPVSVAGLCLLLWVLSGTKLTLEWHGFARVAPLRRTVACIAGAALTSLVFVLPLAAAAIAMARSGDYVSQRYFWRSAPRGVDLATAILGNPMQAFSGGWTRRVDQALGINLLEQTAWLGLVPIGLLVIAIRRRATLPDTTRPWLWVAGLFMVWALGPFLTIAGLDTGVLLPQALARYLPIVANARMPGRAFVVVQLAVAIIAALAVSRWSWRASRVAVLTALIVCEGLGAPYPLYRLPVSDQVDAYLRAADTGAVVELPTGTRDGFGEWGRFDQRALIHQMWHERPLVGGAVSRVPPPVTAGYREASAIRSLIELSSGERRAEALPEDLGPLLSAAGIGFVVVATDAMATPLREAFARRQLAFVMADGTRELYRTIGSRDRR